jgi:hypothetical protein
VDVVGEYAQWGGHACAGSEDRSRDATGFSKDFAKRQVAKKLWHYMLCFETR